MVIDWLQEVIDEKKSFFEKNDGTHKVVTNAMPESRVHLPDPIYIYKVGWRRPDKNGMVKIKGKLVHTKSLNWKGFTDAYAPY